MSLAKTLLGTVASKGLGFGLTFAAGVILYRQLGPEGRGSVDALVAWAGMLLLVAPAMEEPTLALMGSERRDPARLLANAVILALGFGALAYGGLELLIALAPGVLSVPLPEGGRQSMDLSLLRTLALLTPFVLFQRLGLAVLQGLRDMRSFNWVYVIQQVGLFVLVVALVGFGPGQVKHAVYAHGIAIVAGGLLAILFALRHPTIREGRFAPEASSLKALVVEGSRLHGGSVSAWIILESDRLVVNHFEGAAPVGLYGVGIALVGYVRRLFVQPAKEVLGSRLPGLMTQPEVLGQRIAEVARHTITLLLIPALGLIACGYPFILIVYGSEYTPAYGALLWLVPGNLAWAGAVMLSYWFIARKDTWRFTLIGASIAASNLVLNLIFVPRLGWWAAAASSSLCYCTHLAIFLVILRRETGIGPATVLVPRKADLLQWRQMLASLRGKS